MKEKPLIFQIEEALQEKDKVKFEKKAKEISARLGSFNEDGIYFLFSMAETSTSRVLKKPSLDWPLNYYSHIQTRKYLAAFLAENKFKNLSIQYKKVVEKNEILLEKIGETI